MAIDITEETLIRLSGVGEWYRKHTGYCPNRSTVHRWRTRGTRGVKLETVLIGGARFTSVEKLQLFVTATTAAAEGSTAQTRQLVTTLAVSQSDAYLDAEGI